jgi:hypothetical protein
MLDKELPQFRIRENYRPDWLISQNSTKLELDFYIEELNIAFEIQGGQHFFFVPFFHGDKEGYEKRKAYDAEKRNLCDGRGVRLIEICTELDAIVAIKTLREQFSEPVDEKPYLYQEWGKTKKQKNKEVKHKIVVEFNDVEKDTEARKFIKFYLDRRTHKVFRFRYLNQAEQNSLMQQLQKHGWR